MRVCVGGGLFFGTCVGEHFLLKVPRPRTGRRSFLCSTTSVPHVSNKFSAVKFPPQPSAHLLPFNPAVRRGLPPTFAMAMGSGHRQGLEIKIFPRTISKQRSFKD